MAEVYAAADIFVMPSILEVWGLVVNEALASGKAVIASTLAGATADLIVDGETGVRFDPSVPGSLTLALRNLIANPDERARLGRNGQRWIAARGTERYAADMLAAVGIALGGPPGDRA
jgi:glycosyltransferase involved in cell wall biosynthesis